jgi:hypothetical protein
MKWTIGLLLASGLAFLVAGCASTGAGGAPAAGGTQTAAAGGPAGGQAPSLRNFNLRVKCPGVHELKSHGWSDQQIMQQLSVDESDIPACEQWVASQPKGYVPPPPPGFTPKVAPKPAGGAAEPSAANGTTSAAPKQ